MSTKSTTSSQFRLQAKNIFLTYPQCPLSASVALTAIRDLLGEKLEYVIFSKEQHATGEPHLHALIVLKTKLHTRNKRYFDLHDTVQSNKSYHPNIQSARSVNRTLLYVTKDGEVEAWGIEWKKARQAAQKKQSVTSVRIATQLLEKTHTLDEVIEENPGFAMMNLRKIQNFTTYLNLQQVKNVQLPLFPGLRTNSQNAQHRRIFKWVNKNFYNSPTRVHKQKQLFIHGPPNTGKTSLIMYLQQYFKGYELPRAKGFFDGYTDHYDFIFVDEFTGFVTTFFLNQLLEGRPMMLNRKGVAPYPKQKNCPVIILSNKTLANCFPNSGPAVLQPVYERLKIIELQPKTFLNPDQNEYELEMDSSDDTLEMVTSDDECSSTDDLEGGFFPAYSDSSDSSVDESFEEASLLKMKI